MKHMGSLRISDRKGITLIEVLAAAGILAVLATLIYPAIAKARERARSSTCVSNLRHMGSALAAYAADNNNELPGNNDENPGRWYLVLNPYLEKSANSAEGGWKRPSVFICPSNDRQSDMGQFALFFDVGYWCNLFLMPRKTPGTDGKPDTWSNGRGKVRLSSLPAHRILVADNPKGAGSGSYFKYYRNVNESRTQRPYPDGAGEDIHSMARIHGDGVNALFTDFSVRFLKAEDVNRPGSQIETGSYFGDIN
jgi:prepilin-type N-terminal cleavage/methylation domain-containing protein/prepilin-type processing-associated H-X9-DG protein